MLTGANRPIGIFDSGAGGLTVLKEIIKALPQEDIVYLGDTARVPYGSKSKETVIRYSVENTLFLLSRNVKAVVIACNTASALAGERLRRFFNVPFVDVVEAGVREVERLSPMRIGIIGTQATIESGIYQNRIKNKIKSAKIYAKPCPLFVPLVEANKVKNASARAIVEEELLPLRGKIDALLLACTHYPVLTALIKKVLGKDVKIISSSGASAKFLKKNLVSRGIDKKTRFSKKCKIKIYATDAPENFRSLSKVFLGQAVPSKVLKAEQRY